MKWCCVPGCKGNRQRDKIPLFRFPKDLKRCQIWVDNMNSDSIREISIEQLYDRKRVCQLHFEDKMFSSEAKNKLKKFAVPTIFSTIEGIQRAKLEQQEDECEFGEVTGTSYGMLPNFVIIKPQESMATLECDNLKTETMEAPSNVNGEIKEQEIFFGKHFLDPENKEKVKKRKKVETAKEEQLEHNIIKSQNRLISKDNQINKKQHTCPICNKIFLSKYQLDSHHLYIHTNERPFSCPICNKTFKTKNNLKHHFVVHNDERTLYECDECKKSYRHKADLKLHKLTHSGVRPFTCPICKKAFITEDGMKKHMVNHTDERLHVCDECNKTFVYKSILIKHKLVHTGVKPFTCNVCNKSFTYKHNLTEHERIHTNEKPYVCDICNKPFKTSSELKRHRRIHTRSETKKTAQPMFKS